MKYHIVANEDGTTVTIVFSDGKLQTLDGPQANSIIPLLLSRASEEEVRDALPKPLDVFLQPLTERISFDGENIFVDGDMVRNSLSAAIIERHASGYEDVEPLLNFYDNLMENPSAESREQLYDFLDEHGLVITTDGYFLAYKGVANDYLSIHSGYGIVNGKVIDFGKLPNNPGNLLEFPRSQVDNNQAVACAVGLHVGSLAYAKGFAPLVVRVLVNPRDVVSVPLDSGSAKVRVCRYVVLGDYYDDKPVVSTFRNPDGSAEKAPSEKTASEFFQELEEFTSGYSDKGKVAQNYVSLARALGYEKDSVEYFIAEKLDLSHTANAVYRYHILGLE